MPKKELIRYSLKLKERLTSDNSILQKNPLFNSGITLIEILVGLTIFVTIIGGLFLAINPFSQLQKSQDAKRQQDLQQIKNALETYYQDNNCYPTTLNFGAEWRNNETIYMQEVPQDSSCGQAGGFCYEYITDSSAVDSCPQWNVVFAKLSRVPATGSICPLSSISDMCVPDGYDESWACTLSGAVNCQLLAASGFSYNSGAGGNISPTPTASPSGPLTFSDQAVTYTLGGGSGQNPWLQTITIDALWANPGAAQTFAVKAVDATSDITSIKVHLYSDDLSQILTLSQATGTARDGMWSGTITADTYENTYAMAIVGSNTNGVEVCKVLTPSSSTALPGGGMVTFGGYHPGPDAICDAINN